MSAVIAGFDWGAAARKAVRRTIRARARHYHTHPASLDIVYPGLSFATCHQLIAAGAIFAECGKHIGGIGFGGEVTIINAKGVVLLGRWLRRFGGAAERRAA